MRAGGSYHVDGARGWHGKGAIMRFATLRVGESTRMAVDYETHFRLTPFPDLAAALKSFGGDVASLADVSTDESIAREDATYAQPVIDPDKIICLGLNFSDHVAEMSRTGTGFPTLFAKFPSTLTGPYDDIVHTGVSEAMDWEVELAVIIGKPARFVTEAGALDHVAGYTILNDISMRDYQNRTSQFLQGKIFEATTPVGPHMVTRDEVDDGRNLSLTMELDGELMQSGKTTQMIFGIAETISYISQITTLLPGDLVSMGTPSGVGAGRKPPLFLEPGMVIRTSVEGIGSLENRIVGRPA